MAETSLETAPKADAALLDYPHSQYNGSAIVVVFDSSLTKVLIGFCPEAKKRNWAFPGGTMSIRDTGATRGKVARACALRELFGEFGISISQLEFLEQIGSPREYERRDRVSGNQISLVQYSFVAQAKEGVELSDDVLEGDEMIERQFASVSSIINGCFLKRGHPEKFNPVHGKALAQALGLLSSIATSDFAGARFLQFQSMINGLRMRRIYIDSLEVEIKDAMDRREI